jgi:hypothetical protein
VLTIVRMSASAASTVEVLMQSPSESSIKMYVDVDPTPPHRFNILRFEVGG